MYALSPTWELICSSNILTSNICTCMLWTPTKQMTHTYSNCIRNKLQSLQMCYCNNWTTTYREAGFIFNRIFWKRQNCSIAIFAISIDSKQQKKNSSKKVVKMSQQYISEDRTKNITSVNNDILIRESY